MTSPRLWLIAAIAILTATLGYAGLIRLASAADLGKLQSQVLAISAQLNENCSSTLVYSDRDKVSGDVTTIFLTAKHCVSGAPDKDQVLDLPVYQHNRIVKKDRYIGRVLGQYYKADLALVVLKDKRTWFPNVAKLPPKDDDLAMGEDVWTVGYPLGQALTITEGLFGALETLDYPKDGIEYYRATPSIAPGNSGGALWHLNAAGDFELLGVTSAGFRGFPFMAMYTPAPVIRDYLDVAIPKPATN